MIESLQDYWVQLQDLSKNSPVFQGALSLYALSVATFLLRNVPQKIGTYLKRYLSTTLTITNMNTGYHRLMEILERSEVVNRVRYIKFTNGVWGEGDKATKGLGVGHHIIWYARTPLYVNVSEVETQAFQEKLKLSMTKLGRSHKVFDKLKTDIEKESERERDDKTIIYMYEGNHWQRAVRNPPRPLESIILNPGQREGLVERIQRFQNNEDWYIERGVPYQLGILLHGPPGTGKTSLIKGIVSYFGFHIAILPLSSLSRIQEAISELPKNSLLVVEDVDAATSVQMRDDRKDRKNNGDENPKNELKEEKNFSSDGDSLKEAMTSIQKMSLSGILNGIDGLLHLHGRIMIMTTNHPEKLDSALVRPGRVDYQVEVGYVGEVMFKEFLQKFFDYTITETFTLSRDDITISELQNEFLKGQKIDWFLEEYTTLKQNEKAG